VHDVLDLRDLVPDEAEQLLLSGHPAEDLLAGAREAATADDLERLSVISERLRDLAVTEAWRYDEPEAEDELLAVAGRARRTQPSWSQLPDRVRGAWLGRAVGNTLGKPVEGLSRQQVRAYLDAAGPRSTSGYLPLLDPPAARAIQQQGAVALTD
jgi:hypothetical protein